jgi:hypothetical protein
VSSPVSHAPPKHDLRVTNFLFETIRGDRAAANRSIRTPIEPEPPSGFMLAPRGPSPMSATERSLPQALEQRPGPRRRRVTLRSPSLRGRRARGRRRRTSPEPPRGRSSALVPPEKLLVLSPIVCYRPVRADPPRYSVVLFRYALNPYARWADPLMIYGRCWRNVT